jgi:galactokinase
MIAEFQGRFRPAKDIRVFRAPGRVNIIGEHTDYNLGFVMPVALDRATYIATAPSHENKLRIFSEDRQEMGEWEIEELGTVTPRHHWSDYPIGVAQQLIRAGYPISPANLLIRSTVPEGSGLSSSAALEVSTALALLNGRSIDPLDLARLCQRAEREFVGMPCGIMDQYISVFGRENTAVQIDCRSLEHRDVRLPEGVTFLAVNSMVKHALAGSAYKDRVRECAAAVEQIGRTFPGVQSLRDVSPEQLTAVQGDLPEVIRKRARHVVTEDDRVNRFVAAAEAGDLAGMGELMVASHRSLQHDYEVSCAELDFLVDTALTLDGVYGSRMTGGGFGGCTVTMLRPDALARFKEQIAWAYERQFLVRPAIYTCRPSAGAAEVKNLETIPPAK